MKFHGMYRNLVTVLVLTPFQIWNVYYGVLCMKLPYIGPIESIFEGPEILKVLSEELKLPGLKGLCLEPSYSGRRMKSFKILFQQFVWGVQINQYMKKLLHEIKCFFSDSRSAFLLATTLNMHECRNTQYSVQKKNKCPISSCSAHQSAEFS